MRLDRLLTLGLFQPLQHLGLRSRDARLPILMYHSISEGTEAGVKPYYKVLTSPTRFAEHMQWLVDLGYRAVTLSDGLKWLQHHGQRNDLTRNSPQPVVVTFDDGFHDFHTAAFPVLQRHGFSATMYLPTAFIAQVRKSFKCRPCLTWGEVRDLDSAGIEFGSHTVNHPRLTDLRWSDIEFELRDSKTAIEQQIGHSIRSFAYPYAFPQQNRKFAIQFRSILEGCRYQTCVNTTIGRASAADEVLSLPRLPANSADDRRLFCAKIAGAYEWMKNAQNAIKTFKAIGRTEVRRSFLFT